LVAAEASSEPLVIGIDAQGQVFIDDQRLSLQQLHDRLRLEGQRQPTPTIRIDGDRRTAYQHIVHVMDLAQFEGLRQVSLRTRP
jgi:biopolymer transport protein ExbD